MSQHKPQTFARPMKELFFPGRGFGVLRPDFKKDKKHQPPFTEHGRLQHFEPTCAYAQWAHMHRFLSGLEKKIWTRVKFISPKVLKVGIPKVTWLKVKGVGQGQMIRVPNKGRWAHDNVKLLHLLDFLNLTILMRHNAFTMC